MYGEYGPLSQGQILGQLKDCVNKSKELGPAVGILTSEHRDNWGKAHQLLSQGKKHPELMIRHNIDTIFCAAGQNMVVFDAIETSLFLVCIDGPPSPGEIAAPNKLTSLALKMTHGGGSKGNSANRWFDKTIQVSENYRLMAL